MDFFAPIDQWFESLNDALDAVLPWVAASALLAYVISYVAKSLKKYNQETIKGEPHKLSQGEIVTHAIILLLAEGVLYFLFWLLPILLSNLLSKWLSNPAWIIPALRWLEFLGLITLLAYIFGHENGEKRWLYSAIGHVGILFFGWMVDRWTGILCLSAPLILSYYFTLYRLALVILPSAAEDGMEERRKRFAVIASFAWGAQLPILVSGDHAWKKPQVRIPGDFTRDFPFPGVVWTKSHEVAAITAGPQFKRIDGPGLIFTGKLERPFQIIDLRLQLRTSEVDVVSKDGISLRARVFTAFRVDPEPWDQDTREQVARINPALQSAVQPDYTEGSFPFSRARSQAILSNIATKAADPDAPILWDQWALSVVENAARKVISQKDLDELWKPAKDKKFANALDVIAQEIKTEVLPVLRASGILVYAARVVNFTFPVASGKTDEISKQQIASWGAEWLKKRTEMLAEAQAESTRVQQEARAYAESVLLNSIAEGLQRTQEMHPRLPRYVIAMRFLSALQEYIHKRPGEDEDESAKRRINELQSHLRDWQNKFFPGNE